MQLMEWSYRQCEIPSKINEPQEKPKPLKPQMIREGTADNDPDKAILSDTESF